MSITDENQAGQSAQREYTQRRQARKARIKARYGTVGSIVAHSPASRETCRRGDREPREKQRPQEPSRFGSPGAR